MQNGYGIEPGRAFLYGGVPIRFKGRAGDPAGTYLFEDPARLQIQLSEDTLRKLRQDDQLPDWTPPRAGGQPGRVTALSASDAERQRMERQLAYCMAWSESRPPRSEQGLAPLIAAVHLRREAEAKASGRTEPPAPCASAVQKWLHKWLQGGRLADALVPQDRLRGNRDCRLRDCARELMLEAIDEHYLTRKRLPVAEVCRKLAEHIKVLNRTRLPTQQIPPPSYEAVRKAVGDLCKYTTDFCRRGKTYADEKWRGIGAGILTTRANEIWEMDDTRVDLMCVAEDGTTVIGRPWVVVVIDRFTRMIMSAVITFHPPDTTSAMEAVRQAIKSKDEMLAACGIGVDYPAHGRPEAIHVDNAKHYNSVALKRALALLGIDHRTMPVLKAWYRGVVERGIGTMTRQVFHIVPGTTFAGIYERDRETPPETVASTTLPELREKLFRWLVLGYARHHHKGIHDTPIALWKRSVAKDGLEFPLAGQDVDAALSLTCARKLTRGNLQFRHLVYHSAEAARLRTQADAPGEVIIRVDQNDLEMIRFLDPTSGEWLPAYLRQDLVPQVRGRSLEEYDLARALRRSRPREFADGDPNFEATYEEVDRVNAKAARSEKMSERVRAEGARERLLRDAGRRAGPEAAAPPEGEDLASLVERQMREMGAASPAAPTPGTGGAAGETKDWAACQGLGARVRRKKED